MIQNQDKFIFILVSASSFCSDFLDSVHYSVHDIYDLRFIKVSSLFLNQIIHKFHIIIIIIITLGLI